MARDNRPQNPHGETPTDEPKPGGLEAEEPVLTKEDRQAAKAQQRLAERLVQNWRDVNRGGAPVDAGFVVAALQQGVPVEDIRAILRTEALHGPRTSSSFTSPELVEYFTAHPEEIPSLVEAIRSTAGAPNTYAEYLATGGDPNAYRSRGQLIQEAVLGIGGAREAYLAGTSRARYLAEGGEEPSWWRVENDVMAADAQELESQSFARDTGFDNLAGMGATQLESLSGAAQQMLASRRARRAAEGSYFSMAELEGA